MTEPEPPVDPDAPTIDPCSSGSVETTRRKSAAGAALPQRIARYTVRSVIASGGMGTVYLAQQDRPRRAVALKVMLTGLASRSALRRFEYESQILARLRHPNIAQVYEAGTDAACCDLSGRALPYFAMEYVPNARSITAYAAEKGLGTRERLALFTKVCDAVHHGHQKGVIHRDLKPGNILVDSAGEPKIIDFGVARSTDADMAITTLQTDVGELIGTLQYMSPEQCDADPHDLDTRSDVYALGVVLYELLTGSLPYDVSKVAMYDAARVVRTEPPVRPSTINRTLRGDVETITLKALEKDRQRRYQSAADLEQDIRRFLHDEPIEARRPGVVYQLRKFARRHRREVVTAGIILAVVLVAATVSAAALIRAYRAELALSRAVVEAVAKYFGDPRIKASLVERLEAHLTAIVRDRDAALASAAAAGAEVDRYQDEMDRLIRELVAAYEELGDAEGAARWRARLPLTVDDPTVARLLADHASRFDGLKQSYSYGLISCRWVDARGQEQSEFDANAEMWLRWPGSTALRAEKLGEVLAWMGSDGIRTWLFDLTGNERHLIIDDHRKTDPNRDRPISIGGAAMLDLFGIVEMTSDTLLDPRVRVENEGDTYVFLVQGTAGLLRVSLSARDGRVTRVELFSTDRQLLVVSQMSYGGPSDPGADPADAPFPLPWRINMTNLADTVDVTLIFEGVEPAANDQPWERVFDLDRLRRTFEPTKVEDLSTPAPLTRRPVTPG